MIAIKRFIISNKIKRAQDMAAYCRLVSWQAVRAAEQNDELARELTIKLRFLSARKNIMAAYEDSLAGVHRHA